MLSAGAPFNNFGFTMVLRDIESLYVELDDTNSAISALSGRVGTLEIEVGDLAATVATLGTMAYQNANAVAITGGTITGLTALGAAGVALTSGTIAGITSLTASNFALTTGTMASGTLTSTANIGMVSGGKVYWGDINCGVAGLADSAMEMYAGSSGTPTASVTCRVADAITSAVLIEGHYGSVFGTIQLGDGVNAVSMDGAGAISIAGAPLILSSNGTATLTTTASGAFAVTAAGGVSFSTSSGVVSCSGSLTLGNPLAIAYGGTAKTTISSGTFWYASALDTLAEATITPYARSLIDDADAPTARTTLGLAAIAASGSASDLTTGTVPAARMPALTGDVTTTAGTVATAIASGAVTLAKMANLAANSLIGNNTGSPAAPLALTTSQVKTLLAISAGDISGLAAIATSGSASDLGSGTVAAARLPAFSGDVSSSAGSTTLTIGSHVVGSAQLAQIAALSVVCNTTNATGDMQVLSATADGQALLRSGTSLVFGTLATAGMTDAAVTYAKIQNVAGNSVFGRSASTSGVGADITAGTDGHVLRLSGTTLGFGTIATAGITASAVTYAKIQDGSALSVLGRSANSSGALADIAGSNNQVLRISGSVVGFGAVDISTAQVTGTLPIANGGTASTSALDAAIALGFIRYNATRVKTAYTTAASSTHTFNVSSKFFIAVLRGAGGGGGCGTTATASGAGGGCSGGEGETVYIFGKITAATASVSVGAAGTAGTAGGTNVGGDGANSTLTINGVTATSYGGLGGGGGVASGSNDAGTGGSLGTWNELQNTDMLLLRFPGQDGENARVVSISYSGSNFTNYTVRRPLGVGGSRPGASGAGGSAGGDGSAGVAGCVVIWEA